MVVATPGAGGDVQVFTLAFLPANPAQVPVLAKNVTIQGGENFTHQKGPRVLPVPKGHGG